MKKTVFVQFLLGFYVIAYTPGTWAGFFDDTPSTTSQNKKMTKEEQAKLAKQKKEEQARQKQKQQQAAQEKAEADRNSYPSTWDDHQSGKKLFVYDPQKHAWAAYDNDGKLIRTGYGSSGKDWCPDLGRKCHTPSGTYTLIREEGEDCVSSIFPLATANHGAGGAKMPYCMFFNGGYAIHGSNDVPLNENASHGCVRVKPDDAQWLHDEFIDENTIIIILPYG